MRKCSEIRLLFVIYLAFISMPCRLGSNVGSALAFTPQSHRAKIQAPMKSDVRAFKTMSPAKRIGQRSTELRSGFSIPQSSAYLGLLAIQFGCQPILTKKLIPKSIVRSTVILAQDSSRFLLCLIMLLITGTFGEVINQWTLQSALVGAGIPSMLYLIQNYLALIAYQNLAPVTFNILNQTKTLFAALCCFLVMGKRQSPLQVLSLVILLSSALVLERIVPLRIGSRQKEESLEKQESNSDVESKRAEIMSGVVPILVASFTSGLAGALTQKTLQGRGRNPYVLSMELSFFSVFIMFFSLLLGSPDGKRMRQEKITVGWTLKTWIPVVTNAAGGLLVGLVTKHAGAVKKGFALIFGLMLSGLLQTRMSEGDDAISLEQIAGGILASISLWMHSSFPP